MRRYTIAAGRGFAAVTVAVFAGAWQAPYAVVVAAHVVAFVAVPMMCLWAFGFRLIAEADFATLPGIVLSAAIVGAVLTVEHDQHPGPLQWIPWAAYATALAFVVLRLGLAHTKHRAGLALGARRAEHLQERREHLGLPARAASTASAPDESIGAGLPGLRRGRDRTATPETFCHRHVRLIVRADTHCSRFSYARRSMRAPPKAAATSHQVRRRTSVPPSTDNWIGPT